jgi:hypothetical protein
LLVRLTVTFTAKSSKSRVTSVTAFLCSMGAALLAQPNGEWAIALRQ